MNCSTPGLPVHHQLPEFTQTHIHRVSDAIQSSHPLLSPFPPAPNPSQHQRKCELVMHKASLKFQVLKLPIMRSRRNVRGVEQENMVLGELLELQEKGVSRKRKLVRVSNATEKMGKVRTLCAHGTWPLGQHCSPGTSQAALVVKNLPANAGDIRDMGLILGQEDPLKEGMVTHSSILPWRTPWTEEPGRLESRGLQRVGHNWSDLARTHVHLGNNSRAREGKPKIEWMKLNRQHVLALSPLVKGKGRSLRWKHLIEKRDFSIVKTFLRRGMPLSSAEITAQELWSGHPSLNSSW